MSDLTTTVKHCNFCHMTTYRIVFTCSCEKTNCCIGCSHTPKTCPECDGIMKYTPLKQIQFSNSTTIKCPGCKCNLLMAHLRFHIMNACLGDATFKRDFLVTLNSFSKVSITLDNNHYREYKKKLQQDYDDLSDNPETSHLYKVVDPRDKRVHHETPTVIDLSTELNKKRRR